MTARLRRHSPAIVLVVAVLAAILLLPGDNRDTLVLSGYTMGTSYRLQVVVGPAGVDEAELRADTARLLQRMDRELFSTYAEDSELSRFNQAPAGQWIDVSAEFLEVVEMALAVTVETAGAFDITVGPLVNLWGFGPGTEAVRVPSGPELESAMAVVGSGNLSVDPARPALRKEASIYVDLSAIAKGYAVDSVATYLDEQGLGDYFLEIGGELRISGSRSDGRHWVPALERPADGAPAIWATLNSLGERIAIAGSGDYRNYFELDGVRYSHEIDPRSGWPVSHDLAAAYVIDATAARADALATAFMVLGREEGLALARELELAVYFIVRTGVDRFEAVRTEQFVRYLAYEEIEI